MTENEKPQLNRRTLTAGAASVAVAALAGPLTGAAKATGQRSRENTIAAPFVVPALQEWSPGDGAFTLASSNRIVVPPGNGQLLELAQTVADELAELTGVRLQKPGTSEGKTAAGEIRIALDPEDQHPEGGERYRTEGYTTTVTTEHITVTAPAYAGAYHATRSLLQILTRDAEHRVPAGTASDWPDYARRGFLLDVGRRYFTPEFIRDYIRVLSWYKFNDFHIHLNDNEIDPPDGDWNKAQSGFRLASDHPDWSGLAAKDGSYDRATWDSFEVLAEARAVRLTPEFDAPAHSRAFVRFRPDIGLNGGDSDHLDLANPDATQFMRDLFTHFDPWFRSPVVHFGADEYDGPVKHYKDYFNAMATHLKSLGRQPAVWGSLSEMGGTADGYDRDVHVYSWNNGWYGPKAIKNDGFEFININDATLYIVPFADYYHGDGLDGRPLYEKWAPHVFPDGQSVEPSDPALRGSFFGVWNDLVNHTYTELDVHTLVNKTLGVLGQKMWSGDTADPPAYDTFQQRVDALGLGPGLELLDRRG